MVVVVVAGRWALLGYEWQWVMCCYGWLVALRKREKERKRKREREIV